MTCDPSATYHGTCKMTPCSVGRIQYGITSMQLEIVHKLGQKLRIIGHGGGGGGGGGGRGRGDT